MSWSPTHAPTHRFNSVAVSGRRRCSSNTAVGGGSGGGGGVCVCVCVCAWGGDPASSKKTHTKRGTHLCRCLAARAQFWHAAAVPRCAFAWAVCRLTISTGAHRDTACRWGRKANNQFGCHAHTHRCKVDTPQTPSTCVHNCSRTMQCDSVGQRGCSSEQPWTGGASGHSPREQRPDGTPSGLPIRERSVRLSSQLCSMLTHSPPAGPALHVHSPTDVAENDDRVRCVGVSL
jgi:hypothetical protein